ncbi:hypothetical protein [Flavobacterium sp. NRK F7]|uniref:hypothetical protein n=1 Tax=Flavobacterium sp. NRK F7 TaxID=2954930 RepID=UPI0020906EF5|nr:hypothetical protein [Flavobacterium sp. NRK F7]MCO6163948.1 hypothetical protein [Flavobacterium sp. NRK F7]
MRKSIYANLTEREFNLLCQFMKGRTVDFINPFWRVNFMSGLRDYSKEKENHFESYNVDKDELFETLNCLLNIQFIGLIESIDEYWEDEDKYHDSDMICTRCKIEMMQNSIEILEPIRWIPEEQTIEEFIYESMDKEYDFFVNLQDINGKSKSIWVVKEEDLMGFMLSISNEKYFARIQRNDGFVNYDFVSFLD